MWIAFESPESQAIRENLRPAGWEKLRRVGERAGKMAGRHIGPWLLGSGVLAFMFYPWGLLFYAVGLAVLMLTGRASRQEAARRSIQILCETEYARTHGITPQNFRSYRFPWTR